MAEAEKAKPKQAQDWTENIGWDADKPGFYKSPFGDYPGDIQFPHPFMLEHLKKWWKIGVDPLDERGPLKWEDRWQPQTDAAFSLLLDYGSWKIDGVSVGDARDGNLPADLAEWVTTCARHYVLRKLDPRKRLTLSTVI